MTETDTKFIFENTTIKLDDDNYMDCCGNIISYNNTDEWKLIKLDES